jgi:2-oxo-4-hydroxy-4-carboxy--5-ureidoimidazoline (OHCU) decarboxylase
VTTLEKTTDTITNRELQHLRALVKMKVKLLRTEITEREAAQLAEIDGRVARKFQEDTTRTEELRKELDRLVASANRRFNKIIAKYPDVAEPRSNPFGRPWVTRPEDNRTKLRRALVAAVNAQTQAARLRATKLEVELLTKLAVGALHTEAAQAFAEDIPTVEDLMPGAALAEIEARFGGSDDDR